MTSRDYTKEVGLPSQKKTVPRFVAYLVLAVVAVGVSFGVAGVVRQTKENHANEKAATAPTTTAPAATTPTPAPAPSTP